MRALGSRRGVDAALPPRRNRPLELAAGGPPGAGGGHTTQAVTTQAVTTQAPCSHSTQAPHAGTMQPPLSRPVANVRRIYTLEIVYRIYTSYIRYTFFCHILAGYTPLGRAPRGRPRRASPRRVCSSPAWNSAHNRLTNHNKAFCDGTCGHWYPRMNDVGQQARPRACARQLTATRRARAVPDHE